VSEAERLAAVPPDGTAGVVVDALDDWAGVLQGYRECNVAHYEDGEFEAFVVELNEDTHESRLVWWDFVANVWEEDYGTRGVAILRLAHLVEAVVLDKGMMDRDVWLRMASRW
jgi:hypothetical protein